MTLDRELEPGAPVVDEPRARAADVLARFDRDLRHLPTDGVDSADAAARRGRTDRELGMGEQLCSFWDRELGTVFEVGHERRFEFSYDDGGGTRRLEAHLVPERNAAGEVATILSFTRDRSEAHRAEQAAGVGDRRYRELFERALDMIVLFDLDGRIVTANPAVERILGFEPAALVGRSFTSILSPEERAAADARFAAKLAGAETRTAFESMIVRADGTTVPIEATSEIVARDGVPYGVMVIARDISEQVAARTAMEDSERLFRAAFDGVAVGMVIASPTATVLRANDTFARMLGYTPSELVGMSVRHLVHPADREAFAQEHEELRTDRDTPRVVADRRYLCKDGTIKFVHVSVSAVRSSDGTTQYLAAQVDDVTELRHTQTELQETQALQQLMIDSSHDVLAVLDLDGSVRLVSGSAKQTLGYGTDELAQRNFLEFVHPDDREAVGQAVAAARRGEDGEVVRGRIVAADGNTRICDGVFSVGRGPDGKPSFLVANLRDVTDQVELEDQFRHAQKMEAVGRLAGGVAHDFNNLLMVIRGFGELAQDKSRRGEGSLEELAEVLAAAEKATRLTSQLLSFSRRQVLKTATLDLAAIVDEMAGLLGRLIGSSIELTTVLPDAPALVVGDRTQLEQVLANLTVNARDAMPDGGRLTITVAPSDDESQVVLTVRDSGIGMDATTAEHIFEPFFTTKGNDGTGLGLATVHGIVAQSGGQIELESHLNEGTVFTISFPRVEAEPAVADRETAGRAAGGGETILVVDDETTVRAVISMMLSEYGYEVISAGSGAEAIDVVESGSIDLLVTDMVMPGVSGRETAAAVRERRPGTKVLFVSGYSGDHTLQIDQLGPGTAFLQKPFSAEELGRAVRALLDAA